MKLGRNWPDLRVTQWDAWCSFNQVLCPPLPLRTPWPVSFLSFFPSTSYVLRFMRSRHTRVYIYIQKHTLKRRGKSFRGEGRRVPSADARGATRKRLFRSKEQRDAKLYFILFVFFLVSFSVQHGSDGVVNIAKGRSAERNRRISRENYGARDASDSTVLTFRDHRTCEIEYTRQTYVLI